MRTLALAIAVSVFLGAPAAHAVCTSGIDCLRERFGPDTMLRNNRLIDRTQGVARQQPLNPYAARQSRRAAGVDRSVNEDAARLYFEAPPGAFPGPGAVRPDVRYTPDSALGAPWTFESGERRPEIEEGEALTVEPYRPAEPLAATPGGRAMTGAATSGMTARTAPAPGTRLAPGPGARPAARRAAPRDPNRPAGAADLRYSGPANSAARAAGAAGLRYSGSAGPAARR